MNDIKRGLLINYIKSNVSPIMIDFMDGKNIPNSIVLPSETEELNGYYEETEFKEPNWLKELKESQGKILVIDGIDRIEKEEQMKFVEILKYRKVSTFDLPKNTIIIVTAKEINKDKINEEIYSLVAHIEG